MAAASNRLANFAQRLGHRFADQTRLERALTHRSYSAEHNERLEFLGDSVLNLVISSDLYQRYPELTEGELTRLRALLVRESTLAGIARAIDLGDHLRLGGGELKSGGFDRESILADALEAVFGAIYEDGGIEAAVAAIRRLYAEQFATLDPDRIPKDPKTALQEHLQKLGLPLPAYHLRAVSGEPHNQHFLVECVIEAFPDPIPGEGSSRRAAEQQAAAEALSRLRRREAGNQSASQ